MSALAVDMQLDFWTAPEPEQPGKPALAAVARDERVGGERTLEDVLLGAWEELAAHHGTDCLVCGGRMSAGAGPGLVATCRDCGSQLS